MNRSCYILLLCLSTIAAEAQELWTMDRCMQFAVEHSVSIRRQNMENNQRAYDAKTAKLAFLPTVSAQISGQYSWGRNINPETNTYNTITTFNNYYSINAEMSLFDGGRTLNAFRRARLAHANSETTLQKLADEKAIAIMTKFVEAIYNEKSINLAERKLSDSKALLYKTQRLYELGEKRKARRRADGESGGRRRLPTAPSDKSGKVGADGLEVGNELPIEDSLALDTTINVDGVEMDNANTIYESFMTEAPAVKNAEFDVQNAHYDYLIQKSQRLPRLSLGLGINTSYYKNLSQESYGAEAFGKQLSNNMGRYVYLSLSIPVFNPTAWRSARKAKTEWEEAQLALNDTRRKLYDEIAQAVIDRNGYAHEVAQMRKKVEADSLAYHLSARKFEEGMLSTFDLHTAAQSLLGSRIKLLQMQLMLNMKQRLVNYYKGKKLWISK